MPDNRAHLFQKMFSGAHQVPEGLIQGKGLES